MVWTSRPVSRLQGIIRAPGDKSCSHRALIMGGIASGTSHFSGLLEGEDVLRTGAAMAALGATVTQTGPGQWQVTGTGERGLTSPAAPLDFGNSGTGSRLMMGLMAGYELSAELCGDASLSARPMNRILAPLRLMGLTDTAKPDGRLPFRLTGTRALKAITYAPPQASAQVKRPSRRATIPNACCAVSASTLASRAAPGRPAPFHLPAASACPPSRRPFRATRPPPLS